jgi:cytochrome P450
MVSAAKKAVVAPGPRSRFPGDLLLRMTRDRLGFFTEIAQSYGDVVAFRVGGQQLVLLVHPDDIRDVLVTNQKNFTKGRALDRAKMLVGNGLLTSEGEFHLRQRRLVSPAFHRAQIMSYATIMLDATREFREPWKHGQSLDMNAAMMRLTLSIVARALFGARLESEAESIGEALNNAFEAFDFGTSPFTMLTDRLPTPRRRRFQAARLYLDSIVYRLIHERRDDGTDHGDLLSMLLLAQDTQGDGTSMSDEQLRDELLTLFIAGHETTANALTWTWLLLARHPEREAALHAELDAVLRDSAGADRLPTIDDVAALPYTRAVVAESMRLYPPAYMIGRRAIGPHRVREVTYPARTIFLSSQYITHRDPRWWPDPEQFCPERWLTSDESRPKFAYFPFGAGTRICVGEQFAWMEAILVIASLARRWRVRVDGPDPALDPIITLRPKGGLPARLERR